MPKPKRPPLTKFLKLMEYSGFLPVTWINEELDESVDETKRIFLKVTIWKTLLVCAVDFLVVMGEILI